MMFQATMMNQEHPHYGAVKMPFPVPQEQYDSDIEMLAALEIGSFIRKDCHIVEINSKYPALKRLEGTQANFEELHWLAKKLCSFDQYELAQFQAMAEKLKLNQINDFIDLTFCCERVTVLTGFGDLDSVGKRHYLHLHGGCASTEELAQVDGYAEARRLIENGGGTITPYGVVYDNGMTLEHLYDGRFLPPTWMDEDHLLEITMRSIYEPADTKHITWLQLPTSRSRLERAMLRTGINQCAEMALSFSDSRLPAEVDSTLDLEQEHLFVLNQMCSTLSGMNNEELEKLAAVVSMAKPENSREIRQLAENLDQFDFAPKVHTPTELGKYMIQESGHFEYDPNLEDFYNYEQYGLQKLEQEEGVFTDRGYIAYQGTMTLDELMTDDPAETFRQDQEIQFGGMA